MLSQGPSSGTRTLSTTPVISAAATRIPTQHNTTQHNYFLLTFLKKKRYSNGFYTQGHRLPTQHNTTQHNYILKTCLKKKRNRNGFNTQGHHRPTQHKTKKHNYNLKTCLKKNEKQTVIKNKGTIAQHKTQTTNKQKHTRHGPKTPYTHIFHNQIKPKT